MMDSEVEEYFARSRRSIRRVENGLNGNGKDKSKMTGILIRNVKSTSGLLDTGNIALSSGFDYMCIAPIFLENYVRKVLHSKDTEDYVKHAFSWDDLRVSEWTTSKIVGVIDDLSDYMESDNATVSNKAKKLVQRQIEFVHHLGLPALMVELKSDKIINLARIIHSYTSSGSVHFWIRVPLLSTWKDQKAIGSASSSSGDSSDSTISSWELWHKFRTYCNHETRVWPCLTISADLPDDEEIQRWLGETVKSIFVAKECFTSSPNGSPTLSKHHQLVIRKFLALGAQIIFDPQLGDEIPVTEKLAPYKECLDFARTYGNTDPLEDAYFGIRYTQGYEDFLQCPLQPLQDNLESHTYAVFEKDPVKYELYGQAVYDALLDKIPDAEKLTKTVVLMVVGAGRGPIVTASIDAAKRADRKVKFYAIEKNVHAANTLFHLNKLQWDGQVTVVNTDMREWNAPEKADILVSELLGSFSDNELSPECLDGAQKFLKADGTMIPQSYSSYVCPIMSAKLYNEVRRIRESGKNIYAHFETPYVVHMKNRYIIASPQKVFTFSHPKENLAESNDKSITLNFTAKEDSVMHGFCGYFESTLYGNTLMSILPKTFSEGMFSWFPIYFPIRDPVDIKKGDTITTHFWRCSNRSSVWYEWAISSPRTIPIHNPNGRSYTIGL